jgi:Flp pilus assembly pilin Flp
MDRLFLAARKFLAAEDGPTMAEWALMVMLIALACLTGVSLLGTNLRDFYNSVAGMI